MVKEIRGDIIMEGEGISKHSENVRCDILLL